MEIFTRRFANLIILGISDLAFAKTASRYDGEKIVDIHFSVSRIVCDAYINMNLDISAASTYTCVQVV